MIEVIPGILEQQLDEIQKRVASVIDVVDWIQFDVLDNTLMPNVTYNKFEAFQSFSHQAKLEAHLMVANPTKYLPLLAENGFSRVMAHVEGNDIREFLHNGRQYRMEIGLVLDGPSPLELIEPFLDEIDAVQIMTITAGFSYQTFQPQQLAKVKKIRDSYKDLPIAIDGGVNKETAALAVQNGATRLAVTGYLFKQNPDRIAEAIEELKGV